MDDNFFAYLQRLELIGFFSGYALLYAIIFVIAGSANKRTSFITRLVSFLPLSYALSGSLYLGYLLKSWYPEYSYALIRASIQQPWLMVWGLLSILFWLPVFRKKPVLSLLHSLVFFALVAQDIFFNPGKDANLVKNNMKLYTDSLLLQTGSLFVVFIIVMIYRHLRNRQRLVKH